MNTGLQRFKSIRDLDMFFSARERSAWPAITCVLCGECSGSVEKWPYSEHAMLRLFCSMLCLQDAVAAAKMIAAGRTEDVTP